MQVAVDIETTGLDFLTDSIVAVGAVVRTNSGKEIPYLWDMSSYTGYQTVAKQLTELFQEADEVIAHNAAFDFPRLAYHFGVPIPTNIWDTMIGERIIIAGLDVSASLEALLARRKGVELDKSVTTTFEEGVPLSERQKQYLMNDLIHLFDVKEQQQADIQGDLLDDVHDIEYAVTPVFCRMIAHGVRIDRDGLMALINEERDTVYRLTDAIARRMTPHVMKSRIRKYDDQMANLNRYLDAAAAREEELNQEFAAELAGDDSKEAEKEHKRLVREGMKTWRQYNKRPPKPKLDNSPINLDSPAQLMEAFRDMGWMLGSTGTAEMKAYLPKLQGEEKELLRTLIDYRKHSKMVSAFGDPLIQYLDDEDVLHGQFQQYGTQTGRPTCKEPNLLQMPATDVFRSKFIPREGNLFVVADYSQMELRLMAQLSGDEAMLEAFRNDLDLHQHTASLMYQTPYELVTEKQRKVAKTINFMVLYGGGYTKLRSVLASDGVYIGEEEAKKAMKQWHQTYRKASQTISGWGRGAVRYGYTETAMGRKRRFSIAAGTPEWERKGIERQGANHVIQGSNADITKMAMVIIDRLLRKSVPDACIVLQIYDEIVVETPAESANIVHDIVRFAMQAAAEEVLTTIPASVDAVVSRSWSEKDAV